MLKLYDFNVESCIFGIVINSLIQNIERIQCCFFNVRKGGCYDQSNGVFGIYMYVG